MNLFTKALTARKAPFFLKTVNKSIHQSRLNVFLTYPSTNQYHRSNYRKVEMMEGRIQDHYRRMFQQTVFADETEAGVNLLLENVLSGMEDFQNYRSGLQPILFSNYIREVWITESPPSIELQTSDITDTLIAEGDKPPSVDDRTWTKLKSLHAGLQLVLSGKMALNVDSIQHLHSVVGCGLIDDAGSFRTKNVQARKSSVVYSLHQNISVRLDNLLQFIVQKVEERPKDNKEECLRYMVRIGAFFFSEFLLIHPFSNGNGRTARLLLNLLLLNVTSVPFSLYVDGRDRYMQVLERRNNTSPPSHLATYVLYACNDTAAKIRWLCLAM
jgi:fido (protein-threonine AMPylation protein)